MEFISAILIIGLIWFLCALGQKITDEEKENEMRRVQALRNASREDEEGEKNQYDSPNSAFGITRDDPVSRFSSKQINLHFAQHEIVPPKPHSALGKYYANVWEDDNQLHIIYGISRIFNLAENENHQAEMTDLLLRLRRQLRAKYGPDNRDIEVTALHAMDMMKRNSKGVKKDNPVYEYVYNEIKTKYTDLFGETGFSPLMIKQITPAHKWFSTRWEFSNGDIESIEIGCRRFENLINGFLVTAEKKIPDSARILVAYQEKQELTVEEKNIFDNTIKYMKEAEKLTGEVCIYVQYNYRFSDEERIQRANKILRKSVVEHNGNNNDWDAL